MPVPARRLPTHPSGGCGLGQARPTQDGLDDSGASGLVSLKRPALTPPDQDHSASRHHWLTVPRRHPTSRATAAADSPATTRATASRCTPRSNRASPRHKTLLQQVVHPPPEPAQQTLADATFALPGQVVLIAGAALDDTVDVALGRSRVELERLGRSRSSLVALS